MEVSVASPVKSAYRLSIMTRAEEEVSGKGPPGKSFVCWGSSAVPAMTLIAGSAYLLVASSEEPDASVRTSEGTNSLLRSTVEESVCSLRALATR